MAEIVIRCPPHLVESFCEWFSNSGEQDFYEAHQNGTWNETTQKWEEATTYIGTRGYGVNEPIEIVEYDKETDEEVTYVDPVISERQWNEAELAAEILRLREELKGPDGFATWKEAAIAERLARVKLMPEGEISYLQAASKYHSTEWNTMDVVTAYMNGWNKKSN